MQASTLDDVTLLKPQATVRLRGDSAAAYIHLVLRLVSASRLNRGFPDRRLVAGWLACLSPEGSHFIYDDIEVGLRTGLPTEPMVTRVTTDRGLAAEVITNEEGRDPTLAARAGRVSEPGDDPHLRSYRYHRAVAATTVQPSFELVTKLRRVEDLTAHLVVTIDRFDLSEQLFTRTTILFSQTDQRWHQALVRVSDDTPALSRAFANTLARTTAHDSELAFILLSDIAGVKVESVQRCRIGPLFGAGFDGPAAVQRLMDQHPGELVLCLPTDRTGVDIAADSNHDPLSLGYREMIVPEARELIEERRAQLGYRVHRERKFVCTAGIEDSLRAFIAERGPSCVIYPLKEAAHEAS